MTNLCFLSGDFARGQVTLVPDNELLRIVRSVTFELLKPLSHVVERILLGDVEHEDDTLGTSVVGGRDGTESLLASSIPLSRTESGRVMRKQGE